jgi:hypothetical protein
MLSSGGIFTRYWSSFTRLWKSQTIPRRCYSNGDFLTSVEDSILTPFMKVSLLFMYTSYFSLTSSRSKMRLRLRYDPCNVCDTLIKSLCAYTSRNVLCIAGQFCKVQGKNFPRILAFHHREFKMIWFRRSQFVLKTYVVLFFIDEFS